MPYPGGAWATCGPAAAVRVPPAGPAVPGEALAGRGRRLVHRAVQAPTSRQYQRASAQPAPPATIAVTGPRDRSTPLPTAPAAGGQTSRFAGFSTASVGLPWVSGRPVPVRAVAARVGWHRAQAVRMEVTSEFGTHACRWL